MDLSLIIPCYNETDSIAAMKRDLAPVLQELSKTQDVELLFVDDGSADQTLEQLQAAYAHDNPPRLTVRFERHAKNRGVGAAQRTGFASSTGAIVVTSDCDGTYKFTEIFRLLEYLKSDVDVVTASPYHPQGGVAGVPAHRLVLSKGASALYRLLVDRRVHTYTCMFRAYRRRVIESVSFQSDGFLSSAEILINALDMGFRVVELPSVLHTRAVGTSKARLLRIIREHLKFQRSLLSRKLGRALGR